MSYNNLAEMLKVVSRRFPDRIALHFNDQRITYAMLEDSSSRLGESFRKLGLEKERVAIFLLNSPEFIISYFGIIKAGATAVPINNMFKQEETEFILSDSACSAIITSSLFLPVIEPLKEKCKHLKHIILTDAIKPNTTSLSGLLKENAPKPENTGISADNIASILYTSGTTGYPKGAMLTHNNFISNVSSCVAAIEATHNDNFICMLPMFHSFAWTVCVLMPIYAGASITIIDTLRPFRKLVRNVIKKKVTVFASIPSIFHILSEIHIPDEFSQRVLEMIKSLRLCISGAAALPAEILDKFQEKFKITLLEGYGLTETSPVVSLNPLRGKQKAGSVGLAIQGVEVKIVGEDGQETKLGAPGELLARGPNVMKGYLNNPAATAETIKESWLYTGDIAKFDQEGYIYIVDRKKDMINVRGLNVYPKEIENILLTYPAVKEVAVVRAFDKNKGEIPQAFIVLKDNKQSLSSHAIIQFCRKHLAEFKIPKRIEFIDTLPKNTLGKVLKRKLVETGNIN